MTQCLAGVLSKIDKMIVLLLFTEWKRDRWHPWFYRFFKVGSIFRITFWNIYKKQPHHTVCTFRRYNNNWSHNCILYLLWNLLAVHISNLNIKLSYTQCNYQHCPIFPFAYLSNSFLLCTLFTLLIDRSKLIWISYCTGWLRKSQTF